MLGRMHALACPLLGVKCDEQIQLRWALLIGPHQVGRGGERSQRSCRNGLIAGCRPSLNIGINLLEGYREWLWGPPRMDNAQKNGSKHDGGCGRESERRSFHIAA